jgi:hypothetical protein
MTCGLKELLQGAKNAHCILQNVCNVFVSVVICNYTANSLHSDSHWLFYHDHKKTAHMVSKG